MKKAFGVAFGLVLVAGTALASNTGFKLNYDLIQAPGRSGQNFVSYPYFYFPDADVGNTAQTAFDLCQDLNNGVPQNGDIVASVSQFNPDRDTFTTKGCTSPLPGFNLVPGISYAAKLATSAPSPTTIAIVGSHNDNYAPNKGGTLKVNLVVGLTGRESANNPISLPYHIMADTFQDVCVMVNGAPGLNVPVFSIAVFNTASDTFTTKNCTSPVPGPTVKPGEGAFFKPGPATPAPQQISFDVY